MDFAYAVSDLVISRAGAGTISELSALGKPVILVPSPNVAEDHQTKNALALVEKNAAILVKDNKAVEDLIPMAMNLVQTKEKLTKLSNNIIKLALPYADNAIVDEVQYILEKGK